MKLYPSLGLIMATYIEAKPFVTGIGWQQTTDAPFPVYRTRDLTLVVSGMGKTNAAAACAWLCTVAAPACVVNLGAAGANRDDLPLGSIHHIRAVLELERRHFKTGAPFCHRPDVLEGFATARLATREEPVIDTKERSRIAALAELSDMEGAAIVQVCRRFQTPCLLFKSVSDTALHTTGSMIAAHIRQHRTAMLDFFMERFMK